MHAPKTIAALPGTDLGYAIAGVLFIILIVLLVAVWRAAASSAAAGGAAVGGGDRAMRISMRPEPFARLEASGRAVIARLKRRPFDRVSPGDRVEVRRSRAPGDLTEYPGGAKAAVPASVTSVDEFADFTALVKSVGPAEFGSESAAATVRDLSSFYPDGSAGPVVAIRIAADSAAAAKSRPASKK